jgi:deferrochelatase/peroxidase EfeB
MPVPQHGILESPPSHLMLAAITFAGDRSPAASWSALDDLRAAVQRELDGDLADMASAPKEQPPPESGELGFTDKYPRRGLTITLGVSNLGFDALGVPAENRPHDLPASPVTMWDLIASDQGDPQPEDKQPGDLLLQIRSEDPYLNEHVVRSIEREVDGRLAVAWTQTGESRYTVHEASAQRCRRLEARALIGFLDGTSNLHPQKNPDDRALVFVDPDKVPEYPPLPAPTPTSYGGPTFPPPGLRDRPGSEPPWTREGTYMVVRASLNDIRDWDRSTYDEQEKTVGRFKVSGASLDLADDPARVDDAPAFAADQSNLTVPLFSHVRKVNPRRPEDAPRRIFRRGYPLIERAAGTVQRGLVFICFARTISTQFEFIFRAWMDNPDFSPVPNQPAPGKDRLLERYDQQVVVGGYYFVPPLEHAHKATSWLLPRPTA